MRVLWFTNSMSCYAPSGNMCKNVYNGGGWISSAEKMMWKQTDVQLAIAFMANNQPMKAKQNGVTYYPIPKNSSALKKMKIILGGRTNVEKSTWTYYLGYFRRIVDDFNPDIIHVWGSEFHFGLVWKVASCPVILHIQGIIGPYVNAYMPAGISWADMRRYTWNPVRKIKCLYDERMWHNSAYREREIFSGLTATLGRTKWDERVSHCLNPNVAYYHVDEILRDEFYKESERRIPERLTIVTTISSPPYKGFDLILKTAEILKQDLNLDFDWKCYGNINPSFIEKQISIKHQYVGVTLMGVASASELKTAELNATLYFHSSYIDNSPNSLCEAQILGLPTVATNVGGISSLVTDDVDGYLIPTNDPYQAAYCIEKLALNLTLNKEMGEKAKIKALKRHNSENVSRQIMTVYQEVMKHKK